MYQGTNHPLAHFSLICSHQILCLTHSTRLHKFTIQVDRDQIAYLTHFILFLSFISKFQLLHITLHITVSDKCVYVCEVTFCNLKTYRHFWNFQFSLLIFNTVNMHNTISFLFCIMPDIKKTIMKFLQKV